MFEPNTVLRLREPEGTEEEPHPYDRVVVVGQSPVQHATESGSPWAGADATGFIIRPLDGFDATLDKPLGLLDELYEVESYPTDPITGEPLRPENNPRNAPSPEQALAKAARDQAADAPKPRDPSPSLQDNARSPEQVLKRANPPKPRKPRKENLDAS
jgi:hypothetical protein